METITTTEILIRILVAIGLTSIIGLERTLAGKVAGMRTYAMISLGACLFVIISQVVQTPNVLLENPLALAPAIISGIGFIGAGLILFQQAEHKLVGLTTAAGLWVSSGVGIAAGYGLYYIATIATIGAIILFTVFWFFEHILSKFAYKGGKDEEQNRFSNQ